MISAAKDARTRVLALFYLLHERYDLEAKHAGRRLWIDYSESAEIRALLQEVRTTLESEGGCPVVGFASEAQIRQYLGAVIETFESLPGDSANS
ncbi:MULTISPECIES: hypothetical protein [Ramlibacter]|uniref:Uncharacterized protein n=1 Tax=Ramlibacter pinisoli TaxID=2682844 RepID=A0A6N8IYT6_9BURK|nr:MULTISPECIES: hypothetical protein [Ramlibacter]MBA2961820.1 hypothetical protein [Ramlibacter sp. CGMCC 1.13660]MVQ31762.1 hypothetical protein [Ramlibacter pinisoli]